MAASDRRELDRLITARLDAHHRATADLPSACRTAKAAGWDISRIARTAGVSRNTVYRALKEIPVSDIGDITWSDMTAAGIDTDLVSRRPTTVGVDEYSLVIPRDLKIAFGPAVDMENGGTRGWAVAAYHWIEEDEDWDLRVEYHEDTAADALQRVAAEAGVAVGLVRISTPSHGAALALATTLNEPGGVLRGNGRNAEVVDSEILVSEDAFPLLATANEDHDGYFDGARIWFSGDAYPVTMPLDVDLVRQRANPT